MTVNLLRDEIGAVLRQSRIEQSRSLREVAKSARVSLGYLSEVERGQKEPSSEMLNAICNALDISLTQVIKNVLSKLEAAPTPTSISYISLEDSALQIEEAA